MGNTANKSQRAAFAIPTEPVGSIPRPPELIKAIRDHRDGRLTAAELEGCYARATQETIRLFEATGSPVVSDGEQRKYHNFATYMVDGAPNFAPDGFKLQFVDHYRQWPRVTAGPLRYHQYADRFLLEAQRYTSLPIKQAVIAPSAVSLMYPEQELADYPRDNFIADALREHEIEMRACLAKGAHCVQVDFTEGRLACKLDPSGALLNSFILLNNLALDKFDAQDRRRIGIHTCPGGDCDSTHSADVKYSELLPSLFELRAGNFFIALAREPDREQALELIAKHLKPDQRVFVGVIDPLDPRIEAPEEVCERVIEAARYIPLPQLGTTDDCGFSPFFDDESTSRDTAFAKIRARVVGTAMASAVLSAGKLNARPVS